MTLLTKRWDIALKIPPEAERALQDYSPILRQILFNRGIATPQGARDFLEAKVPDANLSTILAGIDEAVERIAAAIQGNETITIYGDYDADGVTSTALMVQTLRAVGAQVEAYIPNRFDEGYGLNIPALTRLQAAGVGLVITVDCGIRGLEQVEYARTIGLDMIITDHHHPGPELPPALVVINPKQPGDPYPDKDLAGVGVAYKLACALLQHWSPPGFSPEQILDLVAIGTVADLVPLIGENRALVKAGLEAIRRPQRQGLISLMAMAAVPAPKITAADIGFRLGPRLNAAGRLDSADLALRLLLTHEVSEAASLAQQLDNLNRKRQTITREMEAAAVSHFETTDSMPFLLFASDVNFNPGVVGLAASRLVDKYYRPAIVAHEGDEYTRGSCRSIPEFHITNALDQCADLLTHHGGHAAAAGFTVLKEKLPLLIDQLEDIAQRELGALNLQPVLHGDVVVSFEDLNFDLIKDLKRLQPTGYGNTDPTLVTRNLRVVHSRLVGRDGTHLKLRLSDGQKTLDGIAFGKGEWKNQLPPLIDVLYQFEENEFNGRTSLQLNIKDIKPASNLG